MGKFGFSFSAKRALGITKVRSKIARSTGIPTTKAGRRRKFALGAVALRLLSGHARPSSPTSPQVVYVVAEPSPKRSGFLTSLLRILGFLVFLPGLLMVAAGVIVYFVDVKPHLGPSLFVGLPGLLLVLLGLRWMRQQ